MTRLQPDDRIVLIDKVDRSRSVLIDNHSLNVFDYQFEDREYTNRLNARDFFKKPWGTWLANTIQTFVLYDTVLVDSVLFEAGEPSVSRSQKLFPSVVKGVFVRQTARDRVAQRVDAAVDRSPDRILDMPESTRTQWKWLDSSEKPLLDKMDHQAPSLIPPELAQDPELLQALDRKKPVWTGFSSKILDSSMTVARAHFYLELSRELDVPLSIDPVRSTYLRTLVDAMQREFARGTPDLVLDRFQKKIAAGPSTSKDEFLRFDLRIPPVPEYVLRVAKERKISLYEATQEVRNAVHAASFREWCSRLFSLRKEGSLHAATEYNRMTAEFEKACKKWASDAGEGVAYKHRTLSLGDLPLVGKILKVFSMDKHTVKDPVLVPDKSYRYFLFLNDLLLPPSR